jgi:hypothetical protein
MDAAILEVGNQGELVYLRSLALAKLINRGGLIQRSQMAPLARKIRHYNDVSDALIAHHLWVPGTASDEVRLRTWAKYNPLPDEEESAKEQVNARQRRHRDRGKNPTVIDVSRVTPLPNSREDEIEEGSDRTPSGSVRSEPPADAPRFAPGAARRPGAAEVGSELAAAKQRIEEARKKVHGAGNNVSFRRRPSGNDSPFAESMKKLAEMAQRPSEPETETP